METVSGFPYIFLHESAGLLTKHTHLCVEKGNGGLFSVLYRNLLTLLLISLVW